MRTRHSSPHTPSWFRRAAALGLVVALGFTTGCEIEQTQDAALPDVDVSVEEGQLPAYDIEGPDVDVGVTTQIVQVPRIVVVMEEEEVEVPYIDIDGPGMEDKEERTIAVELEARDVPYDVTIQEIYHTGSELIVLSTVEELEGTLSDEVNRFSDRLVLNAPEVPVRHIIIGDRPEGDHNNQYRFVSSRGLVENLIQDARLIYERP